MSILVVVVVVVVVLFLFSLPLFMVDVYLFIYLFLLKSSVLLLTPSFNQNSYCFFFFLPYFQCSKERNNIIDDDILWLANYLSSLITIFKEGLTAPPPPFSFPAHFLFSFSWDKFVPMLLSFCTATGFLATFKVLKNEITLQIIIFSGWEFI